MKEVKTYTHQEVVAIMQNTARKNGLELFLMSSDEGAGGYNYGGSAGNEIMLAPFVQGAAGEKINGIPLQADCNNPLECMLISFFHEFAHCKLSNEIPNVIRGCSSNGTSRYQFELWITMKGIEQAQKQGIVFSDETVKWMIGQAATYGGHDSVLVTKAKPYEYTIVRNV